MHSQSVQAKHSPRSNSHRIAHNYWIRQTESPRDETLTETLQDLRQENIKLSQSLQRKTEYLHAAQQRIEELKQEVNKSKDVAERMQSWEGRLAVCGQHGENSRNMVSDRRRVQTRISKPKKQKGILDSGGRISQRIGRQGFPQISNPRNRHGNDRWRKSHGQRPASSADETELCARLEQIALAFCRELIDDWLCPCCGACNFH